jgi:hypothetical protein
MHCRVISNHRFQTRELLILIAISFLTIVENEFVACAQGAIPTTTGIVGWWKGESNVMDAVSGTSGWVTNGASYGPGEVGTGFSFDGVDDRVVVPDNPGLHFGSNQNFSVETWIKAFPTPGNYYGIAVIADKAYTPDNLSTVGWVFYLDYGVLGLNMCQAPLSPLNYSFWHAPSPDLQDGKFHHVAVTLERTSTTGGKMYVDGNVVLTFNPTSQSGDLSNEVPLRIGNHGNPSLNAFFKGIIDEVSIYNRALSSAEIQAIFLAGASGKSSVYYIADGIPSAWREKYFGTVAPSSPWIAANADPDRDGAVNYEEFLANTDPLDSASKPTNQSPLISFNPDGGEFTNLLQVTLSTPVTNGTITYSVADLLQTNQTATTNFYSQPILADGPITINAVVYVNGYPVSRVYSATYSRIYAVDDGIPNDWREQFFGAGYRTDPRVAVDADPDGDGANNLTEYLAGTSPTDPKSVLKVTEIRLAPVITWDSVSNKLYRVLRRDDINTDEWVSLNPLVRATGSTSFFTDYTATNHRAFYWVEPVAP